MHLGLSELLDFYRAHRTDDALVLGTVVATEGSTYRKPGAMMLIAGDGSHAGLISGGCLENDLAMHARDVFAEGLAREVCYDMSHGDDFAFGMGLGCDGVIRLLLQRLRRETGFGFLDTLDRAWRARRSGLLALVSGSSDPAQVSGSFALDCGEGFRAGDAALLGGQEKTARPEGGDMSRRFMRSRVETAGGTVETLLLPLVPPPWVLICGAGIDAVPVARLATGMGWRCSVVDHRPGFARPDRFPAGCEVAELQPSELAGNVPLASIDAAVLMTHNLGHDRVYLAQVVAAGTRYIGLLGPRARRDRLLKEIGAEGAHIFGPAGLDIGAELPESIALAIIAEIHAFLNRRDGRMLTGAAPPG